MAQQGLKQDDQGNWVNYNISDSKDTGWNDSIINAKLEKNVDRGPKRAVFTADTVKNEIDIDPYNGAYDDYIPWWLRKDGEGGGIDKDKDITGTTKELTPYEEVFGKPTLGAQTFNLTGKSIQELYAEKDKPGLTYKEQFKKSGLSLTGAAVRIGAAKWKDKSLESEIRRREESNILLHGTKTPTVEQTWGEDDRDTGGLGGAGITTATYAGDKEPMKRGGGGVLTRKTKQAQEPTGGYGQDIEEQRAQERTQQREQQRRDELTSSFAGEEGPSNGKDSGDRGGCVVATHAVNAGVFTTQTKREAIRWCVKNLHRTWWGEAIRRGYKYYGQKAIDQGTVKKHYQEFKNYLAFATGRKRNLKNAWTFLYRTIQFFIKGITI